MIGQFLCRHGWHKWRLFQKETPKIVFFCRECVRCGRQEMLGAGPMGDGEWRSADQPFQFSWERDEFMKENGKKIDQIQKDLLEIKVHFKGEGE